MPNGYPYFSVRCEACLRHAKKWTARISLHDAAPILAHVGRNKHACRLTANWAGKQYPATTTLSRLRAKPWFLRAAVPATELDCASWAPPRWRGRDGAIPVS